MKVSLSTFSVAMQTCSIPADVTDGGRMICRMPVVELPRDISEELQHLGRQINGTQGNGVAAYVENNDSFRVDVYIGLILDGYNVYNNISAINQGIKFQFFPNPTVTCQSNWTMVSPIGSYVVQIQVSFPRRLCIKIWINVINCESKHCSLNLRYSQHHNLNSVLIRVRLRQRLQTAKNIKF